ncbi:MAG: hypothetical protein AAF458_00710 [Pseudomonadota bacterium]
MNSTHQILRGALLMSVISAALLGGPVSAQQNNERVGVAAAVSGYVFKSSVSGQLGTRIRSGAPIFQGERITTGSKGRMQLLLTDQSVFTMGPRSSMVMDEYSYKPEDDDKGSVVARFVSGVFRFLTGRVAAKRPTSMRMRANTVATIGIRGTSGVIEVVPVNDPPIIEFANGGAPVRDNLPIAPMNDLPADSVTTALLGGGFNDFGDPGGSLLFTSDLPGGPPPQSINSDELAYTLDSQGNLSTAPSADFVQQSLGRLNLPPPPLNQDGGDGRAGGSDNARVGAEAAEVFGNIGQRSTADSQRLAQGSTTFGGLLRPSDFNPGTTISGSGSGNIAQNDGKTGSFSTSFSFSTNTLSGSFSVDIFPSGGTTLSGGAASFDIPSSDSFISGSNLPISGYPSAASASIQSFQVQNIAESNGEVKPHVNMNLEFSDSISGQSGSGGTVFQVN